MRLSLKVFRWGYKSVIWELPLPTENTAAQPYYTEKPKPESKGPSAGGRICGEIQLPGCLREALRAASSPLSSTPSCKAYHSRMSGKLSGKTKSEGLPLLRE